MEDKTLSPVEQKSPHGHSLIKILTLFLYGFCLPLGGSAQQQTVKYSLFYPVPAGQLRDMETDRPDVTESPFTVDAGHFQYETDLFRVIREKSDLSKTNTLLINQANLKIGLTGSTALHVGFQSYGEMRQKNLASGEKTIGHGIGDLTLRVKQNLFGNDGGNFALEVAKDVKLDAGFNYGIQHHAARRYFLGAACRF